MAIDLITVQLFDEPKRSELVVSVRITGTAEGPNAHVNLAHEGETEAEGTGIDSCGEGSPNA